MAGVILRVRRRLLARERVVRDRQNPMDFYTDDQLYSAFRFQRHELFALCDEMMEDLQLMSRGGSLPPILQVLLTLRFYATGTFQSVMADMIGVNQSTASRVITRGNLRLDKSLVPADFIFWMAVTDALIKRMAQWIYLPCQAEADKHKLNFFNKAGFPNVIGCIDGTHVKIQAPSLNEHLYVNRKNQHSINVQVICDANLTIINCIAKWPGSVHDARILRESSLFNDFEGHPKPLAGHFLGDSGYMLRDWLLTPVLNPQSAKEQAYNDAHSITRATIERCIGVAKRRWHCLHDELRVAPHKACKIICACFMLHNRAIKLNHPLPELPDSLPCEPATEESSSSRPSEQARAAAGKVARQRVIDQFF